MKMTIFKKLRTYLENYWAIQDAWEAERKQRKEFCNTLDNLILENLDEYMKKVGRDTPAGHSAAGYFASYYGRRFK